jgi:hypothetical protein
MLWGIWKLELEEELQMSTLDFSQWGLIIDHVSMQETKKTFILPHIFLMARNTPISIAIPSLYVLSDE